MGTILDDLGKDIGNEFAADLDAVRTIASAVKADPLGSAQIAGSYAMELADAATPYILAAARHPAIAQACAVAGGLDAVQDKVNMVEGLGDMALGRPLPAPKEAGLLTHIGDALSQRNTYAPGSEAALACEAGQKIGEVGTNFFIGMKVGGAVFKTLGRVAKPLTTAFKRAAAKIPRPEMPAATPQIAKTVMGKAWGATKATASGTHNWVVQPMVGAAVIGAVAKQATAFKDEYRANHPAGTEPSPAPLAAFAVPTPMRF